MNNGGRDAIKLYAENEEILTGDIPSIIIKRYDESDYELGCHTDSLLLPMLEERTRQTGELETLLVVARRKGILKTTRTKETVLAIRLYEALLHPIFDPVKHVLSLDSFAHLDPDTTAKGSSFRESERDKREFQAKVTSLAELFISICEKYKYDFPADRPLFIDLTSELRLCQIGSWKPPTLTRWCGEALKRLGLKCPPGPLTKEARSQRTHVIELMREGIPK